MRFLLAVIILLLASRSFAQPELLPPSALERVPLILAAIDPARPEAMVEVEDRLAALGKQGVKIVQQHYAAAQAELLKAEEENRPREAWQLKTRVQLFGQVLVRLQTGMNPPALIRAWMGKEGLEELPRYALTLLRDPDLDRGFPRHYFYLTRSLPAKEAKPPVRLFAVARNGAITPFGTIEDLRQFFLANLPPLKNLATRVKGQPPGDLRDASRNALLIWLRLSRELHGDGYFRFAALDEVTVEELPGEKKTGPILRATGSIEALPDAGNRGEITATLEFRTKRYRLADVRETAGVQPGSRPDVSQLLDLAVSGQAEQDLLGMGLLAFDYLMDWRINAAPELQTAIDRLCVRIVERE